MVDFLAFILWSFFQSPNKFMPSVVLDWASRESKDLGAEEKFNGDTISNSPTSSLSSEKTMVDIEAAGEIDDEFSFTFAPPNSGSIFEFRRFKTGKTACDFDGPIATKPIIEILAVSTLNLDVTSV
jgi:hypothetical protein